MGICGGAEWRLEQEAGKRGQDSANVSERGVLDMDVDWS